MTIGNLPQGQKDSSTPPARNACLPPHIFVISFMLHFLPQNKIILLFWLLTLFITFRTVKG